MLKRMVKDGLGGDAFMSQDQWTMASCGIFLKWITDKAGNNSSGQ